MVLLIVLFCGFFVAIPTIILPTSQKLLRNNTNFKLLIGLSIVIIVFTIISFNEFITDEVEELAFIALSPLSFLILHRAVDKFWQKKFGRHIYFYKKYSDDKESKESTWKEFFVQILILIIPFFWLIIGDYVVKYCR